MKNLLIVFLAFTLHQSVAQNITFDNVPPLNGSSTSSGGSVFNFTTNQNIVIQNFRGSFSSTSGTITIWYNTQKVNGQPAGGLSGWTNLGSAALTGQSTAGNNIVQTIPIPVNITLNAGDTIGVAYQWTGSSYPTNNTTIPTFTDGVVTIIADGSCAYSANSGLMVFTSPRQVNGGVVYQFNGPCINPPYAGNAVSTLTTTCSGQNFTLSMDSSTAGIGQTYQWQMSSDSAIWSNIVGANTGTYLTSQTATQWFRCILNCGTGADTSGSVKVNTSTTPLPGGTYTINNSLPTSATNYNSFGAFLQSIACNGIGGPVVLNVANTGTDYQEQVMMTNINTSSTNTITINGNGATLSAAGGTNRGTLILVGTQYININNLRIQTTVATNGYAVELRNDARYIVFDSCEFIAPITATATSSAAFVSSNTTSNPITAGLAMRDVEVKNSLIEGGHYGIVINGPSVAPWATNNVVENCIIRDFYSYGLYVRGQENGSFVGNEISRPLKTSATTTYGIYGAGQLEGVRIESNDIHNLGDQLTANTSACYPIYFTAAVGTSTNPCIVANNLVYNNFMNGIHYGIYILGVSNYLNFYHNSISLNHSSATNTSAQRVVFISSTNAGIFEFTNNIFSLEHSGTGVKHCVYLSSTVPIFAINFNQYHINSGGTTNHIGYQTSNRTTISDWQFAGHELNGIEGDPIFTDLISNNLTPQSGFGNNVAQNLNSYVPTDFNGVNRSNFPDIGAIEYTPITEDIALLSGEIARGDCLSTSDTVRIEIQNLIGQPVDFALTPLSINWNISGPVNSNGTIVVNSGNLPLLGTMSVIATTANLSQVGVYTLNAHLAPNSMNLLSSNDTLLAVQEEVFSLFNVSSGPTSVSNIQTVVDLNASSPLFPQSDFFISEVCHWRGSTTGVPAGGWPTYMISDDYIELTGVPYADISGYIFESYTGTSQDGPSHVLPPGTVFGPNGTMILAIGQLGASQPSPANYYYHTGGITFFSSTTASGHVIKSPQGAVVDAVAYGAYTFPAISGVTPADWTGTTTSASSAGIRLETPDFNNGTGWINSNSSPQSPNVVNPGVSVPAAQSVSGFTWTLNGVVVDSFPNIIVGPWTQDGVYHYIATYITPCGVFTDTVTITVVLPCDNPINAAATSTSCTELEISWNSVPNRITSSVEYGPTGFTPGTGSITLGASSPLHITGLNGGTTYDIYIVDTCANGFSNATLLTTTTLNAPLPSVSATYNQTSAGATSATVSFDASASTDYSTLGWDFGDGSTGAGAVVSHNYTANQSYTVVLTGTNDCGTTTQTYQVTVAGIGLESEISRTLSVYPNPTRGVFSIAFSNEIKDDVQISITSATGQLIGEWNNASVQGQFKQDFDLSSYPAGVYFLKISSNQGVVNQRIILQK